MQHQITTLQNLVQQAVRNTRNLLFGLHPPILEAQGLIPAFEYYVDQLRSVSSVEIHFESIEQVNFGAKINGGIFSIVKEAVNNAVRHANANNIWLSVEIDEDNFVTTVRDDGRGFDVEAVESSGGKQKPLGLIQMKEQAAAIEAHLQIKSRSQSPRRGTVVQLTLPLPKKRSASWPKEKLHD